VEVEVAGVDSLAKQDVDGPPDEFVGVVGVECCHQHREFVAGLPVCRHRQFLLELPVGVLDSVGQVVETHVTSWERDADTRYAPAVSSPVS